MKRIPLLAPLAAALALAVTCGALAQSAPDAVRQKELAAAREELHRAARRVAELSEGMADERRVVMERHMQQRPMVGVVLEPDDVAGVRIAAVTPEGAAAQAGLRAGDRVVAIDGKPLTGSDGEARMDDARERLRALPAAKPVALAYVRQGRNASVKVMPKIGDGFALARDFEADFARTHAMRVREGKQMRMLPHEGRLLVAPDGVAPEIHREIVRLDRGCQGGDCALAEALRWNGLNLASLDPQLGRYFGSDRGVLVLSIPKDMGGLQAGDVILKLEGQAVDSPREVMAAAHSHKAGSGVSVEYLRDRKRATTTLVLPERRMMFLPPEPPMRPVPPAAPPAPPTPMAAAAPPPPAAPLAPMRPAAPPTPPAPPAPMSLAAPPAPPAPPPPAAIPEPPAPPPPPPPDDTR